MCNSLPLEHAEGHSVTLALLRLCSSDYMPGRGGDNSRTISGNGISCFAYHVVLCLVMLEFTEICVKFTSSLHSQASREDAGLGLCECERNGGSEAIVHQGEVILVCNSNIFLEFLGT